MQWKTTSDHLKVSVELAEITKTKANTGYGGISGNQNIHIYVHIETD